MVELRPWPADFGVEPVAMNDDGVVVGMSVSYGSGGRSAGTGTAGRPRCPRCATVAAG